MNLPKIETLLLQEMVEVRGGLAGVCECTKGAGQASEDGGKCSCSSGAGQKALSFETAKGEETICTCSSGAGQ
ncbi:MULTISPECIES: hypothetical protein [Bacteroides]|jgi:hypothetical protein|nr:MULTISPECIES: hypothetical protein [Bacteroides]